LTHLNVSDQVCEFADCGLKRTVEREMDNWQTMGLSCVVTVGDRGMAFGASLESAFGIWKLDKAKKFPLAGGGRGVWHFMTAIALSFFAIHDAWRTPATYVRVCSGA
jgi:hypothetical protein